MGPYSFLRSLTVERVDLLSGDWGYRLLAAEPGSRN